MNSPTRNRKKGLLIYQIVVFAFLGVLMLCSKLIMEVLPNIHLLGLFIVCFTVVYRTKALFPIYIYVFLQGVISGFAPWWVPYLYVWTVLWAVTMLLPKNMSRKACAVVYPIVCALHGLLFGVLYAPGQALVFGLNFEQTIAWMIKGLSFDLLHCAGDLFAGLLILPLVDLLRKLDKTIKK